MRLISNAALALVLAACGESSSNTAQSSSRPLAPQSEPQAEASENRPFDVQPIGEFDEPWAAAFMPGTPLLFVTEKAGRVRFVDVSTGRMGSIESGLPTVDYGGQGGLGDIAFGPDWRRGQTSGGSLYLSWAEAGEGGTRGAALGRGTLVCEQADSCRLEALRVIWRQDKVTGRGHYSHRIAFSPDGRYLFLSSGERQKGEPAQSLDVNLGKVLRLTPDGRPAPANPWANRGGRGAEFWTIGHRNILGLAFAPDGRLWAAEMGPRGGDEINLIERGRNYGWPLVSNGSDYSGADIPDHPARPEFAPPKVWWNPSVSPAGLIVYSGDLFPEWKGDILVGALSGQSLLHVEVDGTTARKAHRWDMGARIREVVQGPDGSVYLLEDGRPPGDGRLLKLTPAPQRRR